MQSVTDNCIFPVIVPDAPFDYPHRYARGRATMTTTAKLRRLRTWRYVGCFFAVCRGWSVWHTATTSEKARCTTQCALTHTHTHTHTHTFRTEIFPQTLIVPGKKTYVCAWTVTCTRACSPNPTHENCLHIRLDPARICQYWHRDAEQSRFLPDSRCMCVGCDLYFPSFTESHSSALSVVPPQTHIFGRKTWKSRQFLEAR